MPFALFRVAVVRRLRRLLRPRAVMVAVAADRCCRSTLAFPDRLRAKNDLRLIKKDISQGLRDTRSMLSGHQYTETVSISADFEKFSLHRCAAN
jgi:hypothetical protein